MLGPQQTKIGNIEDDNKTKPLSFQAYMKEIAYCDQFCCPQIEVH